MSAPPRYKDTGRAFRPILPIFPEGRETTFECIFIKKNEYIYTDLNSDNMQKALLKDLGLALLRIGASAMMMTHGYGKLQMLINGAEFGNPIGIGSTPSLFLATLAEFVCPILIIFGFKTRLAAIPTAFTMAVAAFIAHGADPFQKKEMALLYLMAFVVIALAGPGKFSVDRN